MKQRFALYSVAASFLCAIALFGHGGEAAPNLNKRGQFNGQGTFYNTGLGACGHYNKNTDLIAALNSGQFGDGPSNSNPNCGKQAHVTGPGGKDVVVTITDMCPECAFGDLDLSPAAFDALSSPDAGRIAISWDWVGGGGGGGGQKAPPPPPPPKPDPPAPKTVPTIQSAKSLAPTTTVVSTTPTPTPTKDDVFFPFYNGKVVNGSNKGKNAGPLLQNSGNYLSGNV